jgi:hypothetical protein
MKSSILWYVILCVLVVHLHFEGTYYICTKQAVLEVVLYTCIWEVLGSNLGQDFSYRGQGFFVVFLSLSSQMPR